MPSTWAKTAGRVARGIWGALAAVILLLAGAIGFGFGGEDVARMRAFADGVARWQINPEFRKVQSEYVELGAAAMQAKLWGVPSSDVVMGFRSLPGLPEYLAVSATSAAHYDAFSRGELSAYLHLSGEQGVGEAIGMFERLGREKDLSDERVLEFLRSFKLPVPIATDDGAAASVRKLLADIDAGKPLAVRAQPRAFLMSHIAALAENFGASANPIWMNPVQQRLVYRTLDDRVRTERELWRTKQVSDFLAGIWAQGYGQLYLTGIDWALRLRRIGRVIFLVGICVLIVMLAIRAKKRPRTEMRGRSNFTEPAADL